jgi:hypothetical protein
MVFVTIFAIITDRLKFVTTDYYICSVHCRNNPDTLWFAEHYNDSKAEFWGSSLACFILGAYTIIGAIYHYNTVEEGVGADKKQ